MTVLNNNIAKKIEHICARIREIDNMIILAEIEATLESDTSRNEIAREMSDDVNSGVLTVEDLREIREFIHELNRKGKMEKFNKLISGFDAKELRQAQDFLSAALSQK